MKWSLPQQVPLHVFNYLATQTNFEGDSQKETIKMMAQKYQKLKEKYDKVKNAYSTVKVEFEFCSKVKVKYKDMYEKCKTIIDSYKNK